MRRLITIASQLTGRTGGGWETAILLSAVVHVLVVAWLLVTVETAAPIVAKQPVTGKPVIAQAIDPQWAEQELARLEQIKAQRKQKLAATQQKVRDLERDKTKAQQARKKAENKKAEAERKLKQQALLAAKKKKLQAQQRKKELAKQKLAAKELAEQKQTEAQQARKKEQARQAELAKQKKLAEQEKARQRVAAEAKRLERQRREQALQADIAQEQARLDQGLVQQYISAIQARVANSWLRPLNWPAEAICDVAVKLVPGGDVIAAQVVGSCGSAVFDRSVETAVVKASPLPVPEDPRVFNANFRRFTFVFRNEE